MSSDCAPAPFRSAFVEVNAITLHYLDWGGDGPVLVLVHGIGDNPHVFQDFATCLRADFRIIAYARRGHGRSDAPPGPYDGSMLTEDLHQLLDALGIQQAHLLGWSMGGNEITELAGRYPDRVGALVYLDAAYDWSTPTFLKAFGDILAVNSPGAEDLRSLDAFRAWHRAAWLGDIPWTEGLEAYLQELARPDAAGTLHPVPDEEAFAASFAALGAWQRNYTRVQAPALALYASTFFPLDHSDAALAQKLRTFEQDVMVPFRQASMERFRRELPSPTALKFAGRTHMSIGVDRLDELGAAVRDFLRGPAPR
ncbi:alpha/beta fold hydrolase [Microvirga pakistanensis]|uniref:alpha/beta fold hydrolase n=1 Tax=Microvirga pakistanensis TaxID=1682650 RepID=UPI00106B2A2C|nr:alpha/beta hydrolase [Microvirga pakistanensis]